MGDPKLSYSLVGLRSLALESRLFMWSSPDCLPKPSRALKETLALDDCLGFWSDWKIEYVRDGLVRLERRYLLLALPLMGEGVYNACFRIWSWPSFLFSSRILPKEPFYLRSFEGLWPPLTLAVDCTSLLKLFGEICLSFGLTGVSPKHYFRPS